MGPPPPPPPARTGTPSEQTANARASDPDASPIEPADPVPGAPVPAEDVADLEQGAVEFVRRRALRRCAPNLALGLLRCEGETAHVTVSSGQLSFRAQIRVGERLRLTDGCVLRLLKVDPEAIQVRWLEDVADPVEEVEVLRPAPESLLLEEAALYTLPDGVVVGVGNVRDESEAGPCVTLTVFPRGYATNPMQDWDLHIDARVGRRLEGEVVALEIEAIRPAWDDAPGTVRLRR